MQPQGLSWWLSSCAAALMGPLGAFCLRLHFFAVARVAHELTASPVALPFPCLAEAWRQVHGHAAAAGSEGIDHGRLPSVCTSGGRLPPLGRSNDRSPSTEMPPYPPRWAPPHARYRPCGALSVWVLLSTTILCSGVCQSLICSRRPVPPSGLSSHHTPCRCVGLSPPGYTVDLGRCEVV